MFFTSIVYTSYTQLHRSGTVCRSRSGRLRRCKFSTADWKPNFLLGLIVMTDNVSLH